MFPTYDTIKMFADWGMLTDKDAIMYVQIGTITEDQYKELMGKEYVAPTA
ncbi:XkdX family protein [Lentilactobacillus senioris]